MNILYNLMIYVVWFFATFYMVLIILSMFVYKKELFYNNKTILKSNPFISLIIPAYNEEDDVLETINSLKEVTYQNIEFIFLSDGSTDKTSEIISKGIKGLPRFRFIDNEINKGKAATMNQGTELAKGDYIACMDADSVIEKGIFQKILPYFNNEKVGAVTVSVEVNKPKNILQKIIAVEFSLGLSLLLKLFSFMDCIFVTPGPFSIYRADVLRKIGGFDIKNVTEDHEIAYRLHKNGYKINNCMEAKVYTTLPDTFKGNYVQRKRWYSGSIITLFQHKDVLFNKKYGLFGVFIPFNMMMVIMGIVLFTSTSYMFVSKYFKEFMSFRYTNFNFFQHFRFDFSILYYGRANLFGFSMVFVTILFTLFGLAMTKKRYRDNKLGLVGFPFFFFLYQIFWFGAFWAVIRGGKIKWR